MAAAPENSPPRVLIVVAGRHGATREIADAIADVLTGAGLEVDVEDVGGAPDPGGYDAVIVGSAVYYGRWLAPARAFVVARGPSLAGRPVWLFSSGPVGDPPKPEGAPADLDVIRDATGALEHVVFGGRIDRSGLGMRERAVTRVVGAADGDFRDWEEIGSWAAGIADALGAASES